MSQLSNNNNVNEDASGKPQLCVMGCGFFGNSFTENMCSKCYKEKNKGQAQAAALLSINKPVATIERELSPVKAESPKVEELKAESDASKTEILSTESKKDQVDHKKCFTCTKKIGISGFKCKCGFSFCKSHRLPEDHECDYNFKEEALKKLAKENPTVIASKLEKI